MRKVGSKSYTGLVELAKTLPPINTMVELGSHIGESAAIFLNHARVNRIYCVDVWWGDVGGEFESEFDVFAAHHPTVVKIKKFTHDAAADFKDGELDFVYIDAKHAYEYVKRDIDLWLPKIKPDGIIAGHDYVWWLPGVIQAVAERFDRPHHVFRDGSWIVNLAEGYG